jgi:transposase
MITLGFSKSILEKPQENLLIAQRLSNIRLYRLAQALLWHAEGLGIKEIAKLMGVDIKTIINWLKTFMHKGIAWLTGQHYQGRGRKEKLTKALQKQLLELIKERPEANGFHCGI